MLGTRSEKKRKADSLESPPGPLTAKTAKISLPLSIGGTLRCAFDVVVAAGGAEGISLFKPNGIVNAKAVCNTSFFPCSFLMLMTITGPNVQALLVPGFGLQHQES